MDKVSDASDVLCSSGRKREGGRSVNMAATLTALQGVTAAAAYVVNIISSSTLGSEGRGFLALGLQLTYLAAVFVVLGIERPFMTHIQLPFAMAFWTFVSFLRPGAALALLGVVAGAVSIGIGQGVIGIAIVLGSVYALLNGLGKGVRVAAISSGNAWPLVVFTLGTQGGMVLLAIILASLSVVSPLAWLGAYTATGLASVVILVLASKSRSNITVDQESRKVVRSQGLRLLPASIGNTAMVRSDRLILPAFLGTGALGVYSAVSTVMEMASWPIAQWVDASLGRWKGAGNVLRGRDLARLSAGAVVLSALIATGVGAVAYISIVLFLPPEFDQAISLIVPLGISSVIYALGRVQQGVLITRGQAGTVSTVELLGMVASVVGYLTLIPLLGISGAPYGAIVGYSVTAVAGALALYLPRRQK